MTLNSKNESQTGKFWHRDLIKENLFILVENKKLPGQYNYISACTSYKSITHPLPLHTFFIIE